MQVAFTVGAESGNTIPVTVRLTRDTQLTGPLKAKRVIGMYLSPDADGELPADLSSDALAFNHTGTAGVVFDGVDSAINLVKAVTDETGQLDIVVGNNDGDDLYVNVVTPDGRVHTSPVLAFA